MNYIKLLQEHWKNLHFDPKTGEKRLIKSEFDFKTREVEGDLDTAVSMMSLAEEEFRRLGLEKQDPFNDRFYMVFAALLSTYRDFMILRCYIALGFGSGSSDLRKPDDVELMQEINQKAREDFDDRITRLKYRQKSIQKVLGVDANGNKVDFPTDP